MKAVWAKGLREEKNIMLTFQYALQPEAGTVLKLAASNLYRLFVNGELIGYGPARAAHGYSRVDRYELDRWAGQETVLSVEVHSANVNTFYVVDELPFLAAEVWQVQKAAEGCGSAAKTADKLLAQATDFTAYRMTERVQKVRRFSFQRSFTEIYHLQDDPKAFYAGHVGERVPVETEPVEANQLLPRYVSYPKLNIVSVEAVEYGSAAIDPDAKPWRDRAYLGIDPVQFKGFYPEELEEDSGEEAGQFRFAAAGVGSRKGSGLFGEERTECLDGKESCKTLLPESSYQTYDFGRTVTGFFTLHVSAKQETTLFIIFDELLTDRGTYREVSPFRNGCCNVVKYTMPAGEYDLISFEANTARFASVIVTTGEAEISDFGMVLYENPDALEYEYDYHDEELNRIVKAAVNTFAQNAVDVLTDCPSRERAGWLCDSYFSSRAEALFTGKNIVEKSFLENYAMCPQSPFLPEGMLPMCYPADHNDHLYIPNWTMWYILELRNYWKRTGDRGMIEASREKVLGLIRFFRKYENEYGLLENLESWVFIEWSKCNDDDYICGLNYTSNMIWAAALEAAAELYDLPELTQKSAAMKQTIRELAWNGEFFEDNSIRDEKGSLIRTGHTTETCQYYAFYFGTASREEYPELFERMRTQFGPKRDVETVYPEVYQSNAIVGNYLRLELLLEFGYTGQVLQECRDFFTKMADMTGTLWEHSRVNASLNHGFASMAAVYIEECMRK